MSNIENTMQTIQEQLVDVSGKLKAHAERANSDGLAHKEAQAKVDTLLAASGDLQAKLRTVEQKLSEIEGNGAGGDVQHLSMGQAFVNDASFKALSSQAVPRGRADHTFKAAITTVTTGAGNGGALVQNTRLPGYVALPEPRMTIRDLLLQGQMDGNTLEYVRETGFTNAAATVAEGTKKPESSLNFDLVNTSAKVIAHYMKASRQVLSDASQLASIIDGRLRYGLAAIEEQQLLNGNGTGQNLLGLIPQATAYAAPIAVAGETTIDRIRLALLQAELAEFPSSGIVLNPADWAAIELKKDTLGRYIIGNPQGTISASLWNLPVVTTQAMAVGKFLAGAFSLGAQIFDRWESRVEIATENEDDFVKNMVTILAEKRLAFAVYRPQAFVYGSTVAAAAGAAA
jgi:HK97 family phage major capsid protein